MKKNTYLKIILLTIILIGFVVRIDVSSQKIVKFQNAEAIPVWVLGDIPAWIEFAWEMIQRYWEGYIKPALRDQASKRLNDLIVQQTLDWINNGTKPTISNPSVFAKQARNIAFDSINNELMESGINLCGPFVPQLRLQLNAMVRSDIGSGIITSCSYDDFKQNLENEENFLESGGWAAYDALFATDNNPYWLSIRVEDAYNKKYASELSQKTNDYLASGGYLSQRSCTDPNAQSQAEAQCQGPYENENDRKACITSALNSLCQKWETNTPGSAVAQAVGNAIGSDSGWAQNIENFVSVVINAFINKMFEKGLASLSSSDIDYDSDIQTQLDSGSISAFNQIKEQILTTYEDVVYYFDSQDYPTFAIWQQIQNITQQGSTQCSPSTQWQQKYDQVSIVVLGLDSMIVKAQDGISRINSINPSAMTSQQLADQTMALQSEYTSFTNLFNVQLAEIGTAKIEGDATETQKLGQEELTLVTGAFTPPSCSSPYSPSPQQ